VVFTFSKKRCEENAATLVNADLCTSVEKSEVHVAIEKALARLKGIPHPFALAHPNQIFRVRQTTATDRPNA
jgi:superfamily II RNA helicase